MKVLMYLDNNHCVPVDAVIKPGLTEEEFVKAWNKAQPGMGTQSGSGRIFEIRRYGNYK